MLQLNNLTAVVKRRKRVGRGRYGGGFCGRGIDGQKARSGAGSELHSSFEGGQKPLMQRVPRRGFCNIFKKEYAIVNLVDLEKHFSAGEKVDRDALITKGLVKKSQKMVKILGNGKVTKKLIVQVDAMSTSGIEAIKAAGGEILHKES